MLRPFYLIVWGILGLNWVIASNCNAAEKPAAGKEEEQASQEFVGLPIEGPGLWHTDYNRAKIQAKAEQKMLFIYFYDEARTAARQAFEDQTLKDAKIQEKLNNFVLCRVPTTSKITVDGNEI